MRLARIRALILPLCALAGDEDDDDDGGDGGNEARGLFAALTQRSPALYHVTPALRRSGMAITTHSQNRLSQTNPNRIV